MEYYIKSTEKLPKAIVRIAAEEIQSARLALQEMKDQEKGIHQARRHFKRLRALIRLVRPEIGEKEFKKQNTFYGDLNRRLSHLRDASSVLESLQRLKDRFNSPKKAKAFQQVEVQLLKVFKKTQRDQSKNGGKLKSVIKKLNKTASLLKGLKPSPDCWENILTGLKIEYSKGHKLQKKGLNRLSQEELHKYRKQIKYLWHHMLLLQNAWKPVLLGFAAETKKLGDLLGNHRDLTLLKMRTKEIEKRLDPKTIRVVIKLAERRQHTLLREAIILSGKISGESPSAFKKRMKKYVNVWLKTTKLK